MKNWKIWAAIVAAVLLIAAIVLYFTVPVFCYAASGLLVGGLGGFIWGYYVGKNKPVEQ